MRWGEVTTLEFVKIYVKHECLWNPSNAGYRSKFLRQKAYKAIALEFETATSKSLSVQEVRIKIKNLRTTYIQEVHKIVRKSSPDAMYEPSLVWFNEMDRCLKLVPNKSHLPASLQSSYNTDNDNSEQMWEPEDAQIDVIENQPDPLVPRSEDEYENARIIDPQDLIKECKQSPPRLRYNNKIKKKKLKQRLYSLEPEIRRSAQEDEFDIYGKYIAAQLRSMDLQKALRVQLKVQKFISDARVEDILESD